MLSSGATVLNNRPKVTRKDCTEPGRALVPHQNILSEAPCVRGPPQNRNNRREIHPGPKNRNNRREIQPGGSVVKNPPVEQETRIGSLGGEDLPGRRKWQPTPIYSCLGNPLDRGAWWATVHWCRKRFRYDLVTKPPPQSCGRDFI